MFNKNKINDFNWQWQIVSTLSNNKFVWWGIVEYKLLKNGNVIPFWGCPVMETIIDQAILLGNEIDVWK